MRKLVTTMARAWPPRSGCTFRRKCSMTTRTSSALTVTVRTCRRQDSHDLTVAGLEPEPVLAAGIFIDLKLGGHQCSPLASSQSQAGYGTPAFKSGCPTPGTPGPHRDTPGGLPVDGRQLRHRLGSASSAATSPAVNLNEVVRDTAMDTGHLKPATWADAQGFAANRKRRLSRGWRNCQDLWIKIF